MDFDPRQLVPMVVRMVLGSITQNFRYALDGAVAALAVMLIFHGEGKFFHRLWSLQFALAVTFVVGYCVQRGIELIVTRVEGTPTVPASATPEEEAESVQHAPGAVGSTKKKQIGAKSTGSSSQARSTLD